MRLQTLVSGVQLNTAGVAEKMNLQSDAIVINQCDCNDYSEYEYNGHTIKCYSFAERGVGLSRNNALLRADADIILFSDEDIVYEDGYADSIIKAFEDRPNADMLLFNVDVQADRATYYTQAETKIHRLNCGRYPAYSFACKTKAIHDRNITYSLLFGGGAKYSNGEDSLFIQDCVKGGMKIWALPIHIGKEVPRPSTWFEGYTDKFFYDRGVLYHYMYGSMAYILALRFLFKNKNTMLKERSFSDAYRLMKKGICIK
ncbi:MAG: glycosyltransferase family 2 protein [Lachnospiraceae bacterium]|nr:glycosyltransferase family 2 protein [Candidatus Colinaster equi]